MMVEKKASVVPFYAFMIALYGLGTWDQHVSNIPGVGEVAAILVWIYFAICFIAVTGMWIWYIAMAINSDYTEEQKKHMRAALELNRGRWEQVRVILMNVLILGLIAGAGHPIIAVFLFFYQQFSKLIRYFLMPSIRLRIGYS